MYTVPIVFRWLINAFVWLFPVPGHVAFIMDGNRRFAKKTSRTYVEGYQSGSEQLKRVLAWCYHLNIRTVTVYALSLDNLGNRPESELKALFALIKERTDEMKANLDKLRETRTRLVFVGDLTAFPSDLRQDMECLMQETRECDQFKLNIALAYSSTAESNDYLLYAAGKSDMYEKKNYDLGEIDLLIRTGYTRRFSDFMLLHIFSSKICFLDCFWPELTFSRFLLTLYKYHGSL